MKVKRYVKHGENSSARIEKWLELQLPIFFPIYFSNRFASILMHEVIKSLGDTGAVI